MIPLLSVAQLGKQFEGERDVAARKMDVMILPLLLVK